MGERPTLCRWCRIDDPEGCERFGASCLDVRREWDQGQELCLLRKLADEVEYMRPHLEDERSVHPALDSAVCADDVLRALDGWKAWKGGGNDG